jgi:signal transduction histidine kinase/DNA-binding response OmpR family regulator/ligand-binding sensor domain-containing protein
MHHLQRTPNLSFGLASLQTLTPCRLALVYCLLLPFVSAAQHSYAQFKTDKYRVEVKIWDRQDGLASSEIGGLFQDSRRFIWIQNHNRMLRFDGRQFIPIDTIDFAEKYRNFNQIDIDEDIHGNIWRFFQLTQEVLIYNSATNQHYTLPAYLGMDTLPQIRSGSRMISMDRVIYIIDNIGGNIWAYDGSFKRVFQDVRSRYWQHNSAALPQDQQNVYYLPGPNKHFWVIHRDLGVMLCNEQGAPLAHYPGLLPAKYHFFIATGNQLYYYPVKTGPGQPQKIYLAGGSEAPLTTLPALHREFYRRNFLANSPDDLSLITEGNDNYTLQLRQKNGREQNLLTLIWDIVNYPDKIPGKLMIIKGNNLPCQTPNGDIWFNSNLGLVQIHFQKRFFESHFKGFSFRNITWLDDKKFYGIYYDNVAMLLDIFNLENKTQNPSFISGKKGISHIGIKDQEIWLGYAGFWAHFDRANHLIKEFAIPGRLHETYNPLFLASGNILYCTPKGIVEIDRAGISRFLLEGTRIECLLQDRKGDMWAGTHKGIYHLASQTMFLDTLKNSNPLYINYIYEAKDGSFWLATNQGLVHWKPFGKDFEQFTTQEGLSDNTLHAVYAGAGEWLWLSSNYGIMAFNSQTHKVRSFFVEDGLAHNEQNLRAHSLGPDGMLYFGGINGITSFNPNDISFDGGEATVPPSVFLQSISCINSTNGNSTEIFRGLVGEVTTPFFLTATTLQLNVNVTQPFFNDKSHHQVEWRIDGYYPNWTPVPASGALTISGLPAGRFDLEIRSRDLTDTENAQPLVIPFRKAYRFYQRPVFWLLTALLFFGATTLIIRWRLRSLKASNLLLEKMVQKRTQDLEHSNANILQQKEQLERIDASKNQLFNNISHEFRTPLTLIQGYADSLLMPPGSTIPAITKPATSIKEQAMRLNKMIHEIMDLSKLQQGVTNLKKEPVEWTSFLSTEFYLFESHAHQKNLDYRLRIEPDEKVYVYIDKQKVERILHNLIGNAIKFTPNVGRILVYCTIREAEIEVVVADTGPGVLPAEQALIFTRYFQGSAPQQSAQTGYGIGLALCREYVELMQGRLWVESRPGEGASFFVVFPRESASFPATIPPEQTTAGLESVRTLAHLLHHQEQNHLLIVEDNEQIRAFFIEILASEYRISTATNGEEALALLENQPDIDVVLSDIMMPVMDGFTLLQKTRTHPVWGFIPFMMITALTAEEGKIQALRLGVDAFLSKPFEVVELKTQIRNLIRNQELRKAFLKQSIPASSQERALNESLPAHELNSLKELPAEKSYDEQWMNDLQAAVLKSMGQFDFKVSDLAYQMHISERTLRNYLKTYTGLAPSDFLQKARLDRAYQLVKDKKYRTIAEIAYAVGFKDAKHFSKLFTKEFGKSPADYLK